MERIVHVKVDLTFSWIEEDYDEMYGKNLSDEQIAEIVKNDFVINGDRKEIGEWAQSSIIGTEVEHIQK